MESRVNWAAGYNSDQASIAIETQADGWKKALEKIAQKSPPNNSGWWSQIFPIGKQTTPQHHVSRHTFLPDCYAFTCVRSSSTLPISHCVVMFTEALGVICFLHHTHIVSHITWYHHWVLFFRRFNNEKMKLKNIPNWSVATLPRHVIGSALAINFMSSKCFYSGSTNIISAIEKTFSPVDSLQWTQWTNMAIEKQKRQKRWRW